MVALTTTADNGRAWRVATTNLFVQSLGGNKHGLFTVTGGGPQVVRSFANDNGPKRELGAVALPRPAKPKRDIPEKPHLDEPSLACQTSPYLPALTGSRDSNQS